MSNEQAILERLDRLEAMIAPMCESARSLNELKADITPLLTGTVQHLTKELGQVEAAFNLEDWYQLLIRGLRSVRHIIWALEQLENLIDLVQTMEPLLKSTVPQLITYLDDLEQKGVLRIIQAGLGVRSKIAAAYTAQDIEAIGDGLVTILGLARQMSEPKTREFLEKLANLPAQIELSACQPVGPLGLFSACGREEVKAGLGVLMELTKAMGKLR